MANGSKILLCCEWRHAGGAYGAAAQIETFKFRGGIGGRSGAWFQRVGATLHHLRRRNQRIERIHVARQFDGENIIVGSIGKSVVVGFGKTLSREPIIALRSATDGRRRATLVAAARKHVSSLDGDVAIAIGINAHFRTAFATDRHQCAIGKGDFHLSGGNGAFSAISRGQIQICKSLRHERHTCKEQKR